MGVVVREIRRETPMATLRTTANSRKSRPTMPPISRMGIKTATSEVLMERTVKPISLAPFMVASRGFMPFSMWRVMFTISTGFVVDDAIVVIENITRHMENGMKPLEATMKGASEIGFTVLSMSTSLVAVFIPILLMGGIVGRLFREFAVVLSVAIGVSLFVSLTTTPMMCARFLRPETGRHNRLYRFSENAFNRVLRIYDLCLRWVLRHQLPVLGVTLLTMVVSVGLYKY